MRCFSKMSRKFPKKYNKWHVIETNEVSLEDQNCWFNLGELLVHRSRRIRINVIQVVLILLLQDYAIDTKMFQNRNKTCPSNQYTDDKINMKM